MIILIMIYFYYIEGKSRVKEFENAGHIPLARRMPNAPDKLLRTPLF